MGQVSNVLLLTAETYSKHINPRDNVVKPLFGDAATATLIEGRDVLEDGIHSFVFGTDGSGYDKLIVPAGGMRNRAKNKELLEIEDEFGNFRSEQDLFMNGSAISDFALDVVPSLVDKILNKANSKRSDIDYFVFHQANKFMLEFLQHKCDLIGLPFWNDVKNCGNTVSNSIPIAISDMLQQRPKEEMMDVLIVGFGVGLSWSGCVIKL